MCGCVSKRFADMLHAIRPRLGGHSSPSSVTLRVSFSQISFSDDMERVILVNRLIQNVCHGMSDARLKL
ncbi:hypothetical protein SLEP1_g15883 [Rubroshorea leprosula]|uniref:Uncharacterized protein n=1 Tax=Rubroshorea leprosula TaxID=152421 RepID=A0AAV5INZ0_9ROSI|nr:hypothetical protein SLEP1_g15883 [Rubroshorea leprosula]